MPLLPLCLVTLMAAVHAAPGRGQQSVAYARDANMMLLHELNRLNLKSLLGETQKKSLPTAGNRPGLNGIKDVAKTPNVHRRGWGWETLNWVNCKYTKQRILASFICDGDNDCGDWSDEQECDKDPKLTPIDAPGCGLRPLVPNNGVGELDVRKRIAGGYISIPNSWPAICFVYANGYQCGGNLVKNKLGVFYLITAAHCVEPIPFANYRVYCNLHNKWDGFGRDSLKVSNITKHPKFTHVPGSECDIAIYEFVDQPIESDNIKAVCLPNEKHTAGEPAIAVGWGDTVHGGSASDELKQVNKAIISDEACEKALGQTFRKSSMICAAEKTGLGGTCLGDSGGPLYTYTDGRWTLTGVTSFGMKGDCGNKDYPEVFNDVFDMRDWIDQQIN